MLSQLPDTDAVFDELTQFIVDGNISILCGAGISYSPPTNLPTSYVIKKEILLQLLDCDVCNEIRNDLIRDDNDAFRNIQKYQFEYFMSMVNNNILIVDYIAKIYETGLPNINHYFIAMLLINGLTDEILTTNFDTKIEDAYQNIESDKEEINVFFSEGDFSEEKLNSSGKKIIKLHGCCSKPSSIRTTLEDVVKKRLSSSRVPVIMHFFGKEERNILVLGYSFSDDFDVNNLLRLMDNKKSKIFHVKHDSSLSEPLIEPLEDPIQDFRGYKIRINTQDLIDLLAEKFGWQFHDYIQTAPVREWHKHIEKWANSESTALRLFTVASVLWSVRNWDFALELFRRSYDCYEEDKNERGMALALGMVAMIEKDRGDYPNALKKYCTIIELFSKVNEPILKAKAIHQKAMIHQKQNCFAKAIELFRQSSKIAHNNGSFIDYASSLGEIAYIELERGNTSQAMDLYKEVLKIHEENGFLPGIAIVNQDIGILYQTITRHYDAIYYINKAKDMFERIGDVGGYANALCNLGNSIQFNNSNDALELYNESLYLMRLIKDKAGEAGLLYQLSIWHFWYGDYSEGRKFYDEAKKIADEIGFGSLISKIKENEWLYY